MVLNQHSKKLKKLVKKENSFLLANIDFKNNIVESDSIWHGFKDKCEVRRPRFIGLPNSRILKNLEKIGYDIIVFDDKSLFKWFKGGTGKAIFHKCIIKKIFPSLLGPDLVVSSVKFGGFYSIKTGIGKKLHRKKPSKTERGRIYEEFNHQCFLCKTKNNLTLHHIVSRQFGGGTENYNIVPLCKKCHQKVNKKEVDTTKLIELRYKHMFSNLKPLISKF